MDENIEVACPRCGATCVTSAVNNTPRRCHTCGCGLGLSVCVTTPIQPASDEMIERLRPHFPDGTKDVVPQLIARIDAERAARERAERAVQQFENAKAAIFASVQGGARLYDAAAALQVERDEAVARAEKAEGALHRVALRNGEDGPCFCSIAAGPHHLSCLNARAALSRKDGG